MRYRYSVLTYIFGSYEIPHEIENKRDDVEYVLVTDNMELKSSTWNVVYWKGNDRDNPFDKVCYVRYHPFEFVSTDICVKIDGSIFIKDGNLDAIINRFNGHEMCLMIHPARNIIRDEYSAWVRLRKYDIAHANNVYSSLVHLGMDESYRGLYQLSFSIQRRDDVTKSLNDITYSFVRFLGKAGHCERLDQTIFSFVMNNYFRYIDVMPVSEDLITASRYMQWCLHGTNISIPQKHTTIPPFLFDRKCVVETF